MDEENEKKLIQPGYVAWVDLFFFFIEAWEDLTPTSVQEIISPPFFPEVVDMYVPMYLTFFTASYQFS